MPDHDLARLLQRHPSSVLSRRLALRIPYVCPRYRPWTDNETRLLGTKPDAQVAKLIGRTELSVTLKRNKLGIPNRFLKE